MTIEVAAEWCLVLRELGQDAELIRRPPGVRTGETTLGIVDMEPSTRAAVSKVLDGGTSMVLVTSLLRPPNRDAFDASGAGWLDRRSQLHGPALGIERAIRPLAAPVPPIADLWQRPSIVGVGVALLRREGPIPTALDLAFYAGPTDSAAGRALTDLRSLGTIDEHERPRHDALRTQLAARWFGLAAPRRWTPRVPRPGSCSASSTTCAAPAGRISRRASWSPTVRDREVKNRATRGAGARSDGRARATCRNTVTTRPVTVDTIAR